MAIEGVNVSAYSGRDGSVTGAVNLRASHTMCCRVRHTSTTTSGDSLLIGYTTQTSGNASGSYVSRPAGTSTLRYFRYNGVFSYNQVDSSPAAYGDTTTYYHVAYVYDAGAGQIRGYIDGVAAGSVSSATTFVTSTTSVQVAFCAHIGVMTDIIFYGRALSVEEIQYLYQHRRPRNMDGCIAWYPQVDPSTLFTDFSGNGNTATGLGSGTANSQSTDAPPMAWRRSRGGLYMPSGGPVAVAGDAFSASTLAGALNTSKPVAADLASASTLSGAMVQNYPLAGGLTDASTLAGDMVQTYAAAGSLTSASTLAAWARPRWGRRIDNSPGLTRSSFGLPLATGWTVMAWMRHINLATGLGRFYISTTATIELRVTGSNLFLRLNDGSSNVIAHSAADDGNWHHLCLTFDGTTARAFIDAAEVATATPTLTGTVNTLQMDNSAGTGISEIAQAKMWTRALVAAEIASEAAYNTPHCATEYLYAWYALSWQNVTLDGSGNSRTLTAGTGSIEAQTEAPSTDPPPLNALAGTPSSASTLTAALAQSHALEGGADSASTLAALLGQAQPLAGDTFSASTLAALLGQAQPIDGALTSASTLSAALVQAQALAGALFSASTLAGAMVQDYAVAGGLTSASTLAGTLNTLKPLAGDTFSASTLSGAMTQLQALAGTLTSASTLTPAALGIDGQYAGTLTSASTLEGALSTEKPIAGDAFSASTLAAALFVEKPIAGDMVSASTLGGELGQPIDLVGDMASASALTGALIMALSGALTSASSLTGQAVQFQPLDGAAGSASTLGAALTVLLTGGAASASTLAGAMDSLGPRAVAGNATSASTLSGTLTGGGGGGGAGGNARAARRMSALEVPRRPVR